MRFLRDMGVAIRVVEWLRDEGYEGAAIVGEAPALNRPLVSARHPCRCEPRSPGEPVRSQGGSRQAGR